MGREVRRVPKDWEHPRDDDGRYKPMLRGDYCGGYLDMASEWDSDNALWLAGRHPSQLNGTSEGILNFEEWHGVRPDSRDYMPQWTDEQATHWQMYEDTSEGTPISPVMETPEQLARWLVDNNAPAFGGTTATYEQWLSTITRGFAVSAVYSPATGLVSGVEGMHTPPAKE